MDFSPFHRAGITVGNDGAEVLTIGHSNRGREEFVNLVTGKSLARLIDVRRYPNSRRFPHFCEGNLENYLGENGIVYEHRSELGGYRDPDEGSPNTALSEGFQAVADHLNSEDGQRALDDLEQTIETTGTGQRVALMCAEKDFRRCHRRLLADHLTVRGHSVVHVVDETDQVGHELHEHARTRDGYVRYPGLI